VKEQDTITNCNCMEEVKQRIGLMKSLAAWDFVVLLFQINTSIIMLFVLEPIDAEGIIPVI